MTLSEVAAATDLSRAAARRFLLTLQQLGYVRSDGKHFSLTPQVLRLGTSYLSSLELPELAQPHLDRLSERVGESVSVAVLDGTEIVYVARAAKRAIMTVGISVGTRFPAVTTSMGRVLLAALPAERQQELIATSAQASGDAAKTWTESQLHELLKTVAAQGYAATDQELAPGLRSVAMPLTNVHGEVIAAVNISSTTEHDPAAEYLAALRETAEAISADLKVLS